MPEVTATAHSCRLGVPNGSGCWAGRLAGVALVLCVAAASRLGRAADADGPPAPWHLVVDGWLGTGGYEEGGSHEVALAGGLRARVWSSGFELGAGMDATGGDPGYKALHLSLFVGLAADLSRHVRLVGQLGAGSRHVRFSAAEPGFGLGPFSAPEPVAERLLPQASLALGFDYHFGRRSRPGVVLGLWLSAMLDLQGSRLVSDTVHECPLTLDPDARVCRTRTLAHTIGGGAEGLLSLRLGYDTAL